MHKKDLLLVRKTYRYALDKKKGVEHAIQHSTKAFMNTLKHNKT